MTDHGDPEFDGGFEGIVGHQPLKLPRQVKAERVSWMSRTSDTLGDFTKTGIDSYLALIRRNIQQRCNTIQDLMQTIRINKTNNSKHVTPVEFRHTLIKFGVTLPQPLVDNIFRVFDTDRSGTMDFDEFAMWIMNSEFQPAVSYGEAKNELSQEEVLQKKIKIAIEKYPKVWRLMKANINFMELTADVNRFDMGLSEKDVRLCFLLFDQTGTGYIQCNKIMAWATQGVVPRTPTLEQSVKAGKVFPRLSIEKAIFNLANASTDLMSACFSHIPSGKHIMIGFDEFRRCCLAKGLCKETPIKDLFYALGGTVSMKGTVDVDKLIAAIPSNAKILAATGTAPTYKLGERALVPVSRADRNFREALRKSYKHVSMLLQKQDTDMSGYIQSKDLHVILNSNVLPISHQDFRHLIKNLMIDSEQRVSYMHLLQLYNPMKAPHILEGPTAAANEAGQIVTMALQSVNRYLEPEDEVEKTPLNSARGSALAPPESRKHWQTVLRECQKLDSDKSGLVYRESFLKAVNNTALGRSLGSIQVSEIADRFLVRDGQVDYLSCFRTFLNGMTLKLPNANFPKKLGKSRSGVGFEESDSLAAFRKSLPDLSPSRNPPTAMTTESNAVSDAARASMLGRYPPAAVGVCRKCNRIFLPIWRNLRNEFKRLQMKEKRGFISHELFASVMDTFGVRLSGYELQAIGKAFGSGSSGVKFDEFMRICLVSTPEVCRQAGLE